MALNDMLRNYMGGDATFRGGDPGGNFVGAVPYTGRPVGPGLGGMMPSPVRPILDPRVGLGGGTGNYNPGTMLPPSPQPIHRDVRYGAGPMLPPIQFGHHGNQNVHSSLAQLLHLLRGGR